MSFIYKDCVKQIGWWEIIDVLFNWTYTFGSCDNNIELLLSNPIFMSFQLSFNSGYFWRINGTI